MTLQASSSCVRALALCLLCWGCSESVSQETQTGGVGGGGMAGAAGTAGVTSGGAAGSTGGNAAGGSGGAAGSGGGGVGGSAGSAGSAGVAGSAGSGAMGGDSGAGGVGPTGGVGGLGGAAGTAGSGGADAFDAREIVARLSGEKPVNGSDVLEHRFSEAERELARVYLLGLFEALGLSGKRHEYSSGTNIYAELAATTGGSEYVIVGGHYDSVEEGPGANDNATGVAAIVAVARHLAALPSRSKHFVFVFFDQEEAGFLGSSAFVTWVKDQKYVVHSVHCIDQAGWDEDADRAIELDTSADLLKTLYPKVMTDANLTMPLEITLVGRTDHVPFVEAGFIAGTVSEEYFNKDTTPHKHTAEDTFATVNFDYLASTVDVLNHVADELSK